LDGGEWQLPRRMRHSGDGLIRGCERDLVLAYLLHMVKVVKPSEGLAATDELLQAFLTHWQNA
jgi:hypothetical protein